MEPNSLRRNAKSNNYGNYTKRDIKKVAVMEPNISIMKKLYLPYCYFRKICKI